MTDVSWIGFHDEISNMRPGKERKQAIVIDQMNNNLVYRDLWTKNGTYLAFLRIEIDLGTWQRISRSRQELLIGRHKLSGRPIIGIDKGGKPIVDELLSVDFEDSYVKRFYDHPDYFKIPKIPRSSMDLNASFKKLNESHIGRARHVDLIPSCDPTSRRIY